MSSRLLVIAASVLAISALITACGGDHDEMEGPTDPLASAYRNTSIAATGDADIPMIAVDKNGDHMAAIARDGRLTGAIFRDAYGDSFTVWVDELGRPTQARASSPDMLFVFGAYAESAVDVGVIDPSREVQIHKAAPFRLSGAEATENPRVGSGADAALLASQFEWAGHAVQEAIGIVDVIYPDGVDGLLLPTDLIATATSLVTGSQVGIQRSWEAYSTFALDATTAAGPAASPLAAIERSLASTKHIAEEADADIDRMRPQVEEVLRALGMSSLGAADEAGKGGTSGVTRFGEVIAALPRDGLIGSLTFSPNGDTLTAVGRDAVVVWDVQARREIVTVPAPPGTNGYMALSPDGTTLAVDSRGRVSLWDVGAEEELARFGANEWPITGVAISPDGKTVASADWIEFLTLWDVPSGQEIATVDAGTFSINCMTFSPDGATLAISSYLPTTLALWDVASGQKIAALDGHTDTVYAGVFSPDGRTLASASDDTTVRLWDVGSGAEVAKLSGHTGYVFSVVFSPDGQTLASGSADGTIRFWDIGARRLIATIHNRASVGTAAFSPDGRTFATVALGAVKLWSVERWGPAP